MLGRTHFRGEAVNKFGQAPRSYAKSLQNTDILSEPVPCFHSLGTKGNIPLATPQKDGSCYIPTKIQLPPE